eukprot:TRINITY_DN1964_c0_g1_i3.p1 TRINITY_DN1964_c0_g1~~TRINITY_DN1964_c0_g1_i3.p1  ORF type:complete len:225 (-),score=37.99 TRINITY_DN1964_c0_g1_i3:357-1031(-)
MVYNMNRQDVTRSRGLWVVNAAAVFDFQRYGVTLPRRWFMSPVELMYDKAGRIEKNWVLFVHGSRLLISCGLIPHTTMSFRADGTTSTLHSPDSSECFARRFDLSAVAVNQGSNAVLIAPCERGGSSNLAMKLECLGMGRPSYAAVFHTRPKSGLLHFDNYVVVWDSQPPFGVLGIANKISERSCVTTKEAVDAAMEEARTSPSPAGCRRHTTLGATSTRGRSG